MHMHITAQISQSNQTTLTERSQIERTHLVTLTSIKYTVGMEEQREKEGVRINHNHLFLLLKNHHSLNLLY